MRCAKCDGTGQYKDFGKCFQCDGAGELRDTVPASESKHPALRADRERKRDKPMSDQEYERAKAAGDRELKNLRGMLGMRVEDDEEDASSVERQAPEGFTSF